VAVRIRQFGRDALEPRNAGALSFHLPPALYAEVARPMHGYAATLPAGLVSDLRKTQKMIFDMLPAGGKNDHDAADIVCDYCKSIVATLYAPKAQQASVRPKRAAKAREMAGQTLDSLIDSSASDEERHTRKRRLLKGPKEFRDIRDKKR
jgi:hypothetical protein